MNRFSISFEHPWLLLLLLVVPLLWWVSWRPLASLGEGRRFAALCFRSILITLIVLAIAGVQWVWISERTTVIYLLDQSDSIPRAKREVMLRLAIESVARHRREARGDRAGLIVFGREATIEFPPYDENLPFVQDVESYLGRTDATNLEAALKLAAASFPEDSAKRIVIISDGNETLGSAALTARSLVDSGVGIDVVPVAQEATSEILVEKIDIPSSIRQGQPFETRIVISRYTTGNDGQPIRGRLRVTRRVGPEEQTILDQPVTLERDVNVFPIQDTIQQAAGYMYRAEFVPDDPADDALQQNNRADAFTFVRGKGRVLLIEDWATPGEYAALIESLRRSEIEVEVRGSNRLFTSLAELQAYDAIILAGVPRSSGDDAASIASFSDEQIDMLVTNTEQFGCGLLMIGGPLAFGAGGWANTALEKAMPVDFQIKNKRVEAVGALAMILHASEIAQGNYWQKRIGQAALEVLGPMDYCGVLQYSMTGDSWLWNNPVGLSRVGPNRQAMINRLRRMTPGDMPAFQPSMQMALRSLIQVPASVKHMIIISDGDPTPPSPGILVQFRTNNIKISTVAVGAHGPAGHATLQGIATATGGNYYKASNPTALPKIFQREAMRVSRPLVYEPEDGVSPQVAYPHEVLQGLPRDLPPLKGFVLTTVKDSPLVQVGIRADKPAEPENQTILATWAYGLGRTAVFTSDTGFRWADQWTNWSGYDQFFSQLVRWIMRPTESDAKFTVATNTRDGRVEVVVNALDHDDQFLNFLDMQAVAVGPDLQPIPLVMRQTAPGRYVGQFEADTAGAYLVNIIPGPGMAPLTTGASVPFSDEYRLRQANLPLLEDLASLAPTGGETGLLAAPLDNATFQQLLSNDVYRGGLPKAMSLKDVWPYCLLVAAFCLFADVLVRRVSIDYAYPAKWLYRKLRPGESEDDAQRRETLQRLRSRKTQVTDQYEPSVASMRFEFEEPVTSEPLAGAPRKADTPASPASGTQPSMATDSAAEDSYTARLLAAKRAAKKRSSSE
ncbi:MAG: hypothetical protein KatS3mg111_0058 [Pirellulaceae bacterium]|nr:MAG: hypothetical protein KatS3mg111_0058 [Pirellulaceae bacterium]